jgi:ribosomal protein L37AE/L43A
METEKLATQIPQDANAIGSASSAEKPNGSAPKRLFSDPETKGVAIFAAISMSIVALVALWLLFGYVVPLAILAAAGVTLGLVALIKKPSAARALIFCPSCGTKWVPSVNACQRCSWDSRTQQYADPVKALAAKQAIATSASISSQKQPAATQPTTDPFKIQELMRTCPYCGEKILQVARICKHCRSDLTGGQNMPPVEKNKLAPAEVSLPKALNGWNILGAYVIAIVIPFIGFFNGIYLLAKKEVGHGLACIAISILAFFIYLGMWNHFSDEYDRQQYQLNRKVHEEMRRKYGDF